MKARLAGAAFAAALALAPGAAAFAQERKPAAKPPAKTAPRTPATPPATPARQKALQTEHRGLQQQLGALKRQLAAAEASQTEAADALAESEAAISAANRRLRELATERRRIEDQLAVLAERNRAVGGRLGAEERELAALVRAQVVAGRREPWQLLLAGANPNQIARDTAAYAYLARERSRLISQLEDRRAEIETLAAETRARQDELEAVVLDEEKGRRQLLAEQGARKKTLARLEVQIAAQRASIGKLERDEKRLASLVERIGALLAEQERRERAKVRRTPAPTAKAAPAAPARPAAPASADAPAVGRFGALRGKLALPARGEVVGRYGAPRPAEGAGTAPTWKGLLIRAPQGSEVAAVAPGQVVFAEWLRGFGNLLILDHGDGYLSVYGNNESLYKSVGERVSIGETVASVGNTGGGEAPGLYFELRHQGRPFDPLKWMATR